MKPLNIGRLLRILLNNLGIVVGLIFLAFAGTLAGDLILKPAPTFTASLTEFFATHGELLVSLGFIAITLPIVGQYSDERWTR